MVRGQWASPPWRDRVQGKGSSKWREANRCRQLQTATQPGIMPPLQVRTHGSTNRHTHSAFVAPTPAPCDLGTVGFTADHGWLPQNAVGYPPSAVGPTTPHPRTITAQQKHRPQAWEGCHRLPHYPTQMSTDNGQHSHSKMGYDAEL